MSAHALPASLRSVADSAMLDTRPVLHEIFQARARAEPDAIAVRFQDARISYAELNARANRLARFLNTQGLNSQDRIAIRLEPGDERIVALLAILKLGAVACPLHLSLPAKMLTAVVDRVAAKALLTSSYVQDELQASTAPFGNCLIINVSECDEMIASQAEHDLGSRAGWADLAYIVHTSGSTGAPRAVAMSHRAFSYEVRWQIAQSVAAHPPTTLQFSSLGFDLFLTEVMSTLCEGGTLVIATEQVRNSSASLLDAINKYRIERLLISRVVIQALAEEVIRRNEQPSSLSEIMCTGEQLTITAAMRELFKRHACLFYNEYGMSEAPVVAAYVFNDNPDTWPDVPPVGEIISGCEVFILDSNLRSVALGEEGEVYVAGDFLADGYLNADGEASKSFRAHPFKPSDLIFRSGDIGRFSPNGELTLLGRLDGVVNINGIRIGLGGIEAQLRNHPQVRESVVLKLDDQKDARLVAYVSLKERDGAFETVLRQWLGERVPSYAIPAHFIEVAEFPKTHSGKIDRLALPLPSIERPNISAAYAPAESLLETQLLAIWKKVLKVGLIGVKDKVFDLGGTSLSIQELLREINQDLNINLAATILFRYPSVDCLAKHISTSHLNAVEGDGDHHVSEESGDEDLLMRRRRRRSQTNFSKESHGESKS